MKPTVRTQVHLAGLAVAIVAVISEGAALHHIGGADEAFTQLWIMLGLHALASLCAGFALALWFKRPRLAFVLMLGLMNFLVPGLALALATVNWVAITLKRNRERLKILCVEEPSFFKDREKPQSGSRSMQIRPQLHNPRVPVARRLTALLAIQEVPARFSAGLLRSLLSDGTEDIRLLSYGMLEKREKTVSDQILAERTRMEAAESPKEKLNSQRLLAELYWELVHQTLVVGDMRQHCLSEAKRFAQMVLEGDPQDGGMALLYGRALLADSQNKAARECFEGAARNPAARVRILPYLAECAFASADYEKVRELMVELGEPHDMTMARCVEYWT